MNETTDKRHENQQAQFPSLIAGELTTWRAFLLRRHIGRCPECARELAEMTALWSELKALQALSTAKSAPLWPVGDGPEKRPDPVFAFGGLTMKRRTVFAVCAALTLSLTGAVAARQYFYDPFQGLPAGNGLTWEANCDFRGEVRFFDTNGLPHGSISSSRDDDRPAAATVAIGGNRFNLKGAGRHELRASDGTLYGFADLIPQTKEEREGWWAQHYAQMGIEEPLKISHGAKDGYGMAVGFFGSGPDRVDWRFNGVGKIVFRNAATGKIAYVARAAELTPELREEQRRNLSPEEFATTVAEQIPDVPQFTYRIGDKERTVFMPSTTNGCALPLSDGTLLDVITIIADDQTASAHLLPSGKSGDGATDAVKRALDAVTPTR